MRVLLVHNHYRSGAPSGEDAVFANERELLQANGAEVIAYERFNDDLAPAGRLAQFRVGLDAVWSGSSYRDLDERIRRARPDVAHFHNTFPLVSPSAYAACRDNGVAVVQTLHNYRLVCPGALLLRDGKPCEDCVGTSLLPALRHRCYRDSLPATAAVVSMLAFNRRRGTYIQLVDRYIALTQFAASRMVAGGLPADRIDVKPNFLPHDPPFSTPSGERYAVYVGRLSAEKGVRTLLEAWSASPILPLKILGDGPLRLELERTARGRNLPIEFLGLRERGEVLRVVGQAAVQVVPSEWYEGFPMVVLEAYASGTPVLASRLGSLDEIVVESETGMKFRAGDASDLAATLKRLVGDASHLRSLRKSARAAYERHYTAAANYPLLAAIYERALTRNPASPPTHAR